MAYLYRHIDSRLTALVVGIEPHLYRELVIDIVKRARQIIIDDVLETRTQFSLQTYEHRVRRAEMLGVCHNCAKVNCTNTWEDGECDYGFGFYDSYTSRGLYIAFIWGDLADNYWGLREICDCDGCEICEWRAILVELQSI